MFDSEEEKQQNPKNIALAIFRFRARRGIGVFYTLLSIVPLLQALLTELSAPNEIIQISIPIALIAIWIIARMAGLQKFYQMMVTIDLFEGKKENKKASHKLTQILREGLVAPILPLI